MPRHLQHGHLRWEERRALNERMPDVEKAANAIYVERIDTLVDRLADADAELSSPAHWLYHPEGTDNCEDYCLACAEKKVDELNAEHRAVRIAAGLPVGDDADDDEVAPWSVDGGFGSEDGTSICDACGCMLDYHLEGCTLEDELHHFLESREPGPIGDAHEAVELSRLLAGLRDLGPIENDVVERCVALIDLVDQEAVAAEIAARRAGTWTEGAPPGDGPSLPLAA